MKRIILVVCIFVLFVSALSAQAERSPVSIGASYSYLSFFRGGDLWSMMVWANSRIGAHFGVDFFRVGKASVGIDVGILSNLWALIEFPIIARAAYAIDDRFSVGLSGGYIFDKMLQPGGFGDLHFLALSAFVSIKKLTIEVGDAIFLNDASSGLTMESHCLRFLVGLMFPVG